MRIIGLLSWYEEHPSWLAECVASAARLCDHLVAVDGPYALFPGSTRKPASGSEQPEVIMRTAAGAGMGCTVHVPRRPWWGGEVEKRDFMFRLGMTFAEPGKDWFLRIDADEVLSHVPADARNRLAATGMDVADVTLFEREAQQKISDLAASDPDYRAPLRVLFRALPGIGVEQAHYVVTAVAESGRRVLCGNWFVHHLEPAEHLLDAVLEHRTQQRTESRKRQKATYHPHIGRNEIVAPFEEEAVHA